MICEYIFPRVFFDGDDIGDIVTALSNYPKNTSDILAAHDLAWADHRGSADDAATEADRKQQQMELEQLRTQITDLTTERDLALAECAPDIACIAQQLQDAGLNSWGNRASTAAGEIGKERGDTVMGLLFQLRDVAREARSLGQCDRIKFLFNEIRLLTKADRDDEKETGVMPTQEEAVAMQAILDAAKVGHKWINFLGI